jgi:multiple sugar transport system permease protein
MSWIGIASVAVFHFVGSWSEFAFASILIESQRLRTAPVGLAEFIFLLQSAQFNKIGAAAVVMSVPIVVLFMLVQKHFVRGFVAGSVKG